MRKDTLVNNHVYHVFTRSIAGFKIFSSSSNCRRFVDTMAYYRHDPINTKFSRFKNLSAEGKLKHLAGVDNRVLIVAYCLMPTHIHLVLKQIKDDGIMLFMKNSLESFSKYFNVKYKRKGPLWESRFKNVPVKDDEQLLHLTRYVHLNPVSAGIIKKPEEWKYSSYKTYISKNGSDETMVGWGDLLEIDSAKYRNFVEERINYQKQISRIKKLLLDNYNG